jgi:alpha-L-rhamnosidase
MTLDWTIEIPCNTEAVIVLPTLDKKAISDPSIRYIGEENGRSLWRVPSGRYELHIALDPAWGEERKGILTDEFLYEEASFPQCHASTIEELPNGDLIAAYFGGTKEKHPDVCIWVQTKAKGSNRWSAPRKVADGIQNDTLRYPCWNPVLFQVPNKRELWLFYKVGPNVPNWKGYLIRSKNGGKTWSKPESLLPSDGGAPAHIIEHSSGAVISVYGYRKEPYGIRMMVSYDNGDTWQKDIVLVDNELSSDLGYPASVELSDGSILTIYYAKDPVTNASVIKQLIWKIEE